MGSREEPELLPFSGGLQLKKLKYDTFRGSMYNVRQKLEAESFAITQIFATTVTEKKTTVTFFRVINDYQ